MTKKKGHSQEFVVRLFCLKEGQNDGILPPNDRHNLDRTLGSDTTLTRPLSHVSSSASPSALEVRTQALALTWEERKANSHHPPSTIMMAPSFKTSQRNLIINGEDAERGRYPYFVLIGDWCGGSLIAPGKLNADECMM